MKGKIIITDKVYFEYYKLLKPAMGNPNYDVSWKLYEASKQLIEVENVFFAELFEYWFYEQGKSLPGINGRVRNNQPCKAEIKDNKATIIELTKE